MRSLLDTCLSFASCVSLGWYGQCVGCQWVCGTKVQAWGGIGGWVSVCALCSMHVWVYGTVYTIAITDLRVISQVR